MLEFGKVWDKLFGRCVHVMTWHSDLGTWVRTLLRRFAACSESDTWFASHDVFMVIVK